MLYTCDNCGHVTDHACLIPIYEIPDMALKIKPEHYDRLAKLIASDLVDIYRRSRLEHYQKLEQTPGNCFYQRPELWAERYRWDVLNFTVTHTPGLSTALHQYLNDDDIYPVLYELLPIG